MAGKRGGARPGAGRPKGSKNRVPGHVRELARQYTEQAVEELAKLARSARSESARVMAINSLLDRAWGKAPQPIDGDGEGGPITFQKVERVIVDPAQPADAED